MNFKHGCLDVKKSDSWSKVDTVQFVEEVAPDAPFHALPSADESLGVIGQLLDQLSDRPTLILLHISR